MIPTRLKDFHLMVNGASMLGKGITFQPPGIKVETESFRYAGMDGKVKEDQGMDDIDCKFVAAELTPELARLVGSMTEVPITCYGYAEQSPGNKKSEIIFTMRGRIFEQNVGDIQSGKTTDIEFNISCSAYRETVDGQVTKDIDVIAGRRIIGGTDVLAEKRRILKM